jgi:hypothetical protein
MVIIYNNIYISVQKTQTISMRMTAMDNNRSEQDNLTSLNLKLLQQLHTLFQVNQEHFDLDTPCIFFLQSNLRYVKNFLQ